MARMIALFVLLFGWGVGSAVSAAETPDPKSSTSSAPGGSADAAKTDSAPNADPKDEQGRAKAPKIISMKVQGNQKVESDAILTLMKTAVNQTLDGTKVAEDIRTLYDLGYFSDVKLTRKSVGPGEIEVTVHVVEKPAIIKIDYEGMTEITKDDLKDKITSKLYTIVNEGTIATDVRVIAKQYADKGFYLASVTYDLRKKSENEVELIFVVDEGGKVKVGDVYINGNNYFSDADLIDKLASRPISRGSAYGQGSLYQDDFLKRDLEFLSFHYRDWGFADVKVAKPVVNLDVDREFVRMTFEVEEGVQYNVAAIDVSGDLLFTKEELFAAMKLKPGELFRLSRFSRDIEMLVDKYGDLGYAYADVNPKTKFDKEKKTVEINYEITKGEKVYFGEIFMLGNTKTRDNVIRREMQVQDSELFSGTGMSESKKNINRLGFFEESQIVRERAGESTNLLDLKVKVKEKPTGQLQAALGYTPASASGKASVFGQGRYDEKNQFGRAWKSDLTLKWSGKEEMSAETGFTNPRVNDSQWSAGTSAFYSQNQKALIEGVTVKERRIGASVTIGRKIIELIRGSISYRAERVIQKSDAYLLPQFRDDGFSRSTIFRLTRVDTDNYIEPTEGSDIELRQKVTGGPVLGGDFNFYESALDGSYYYPIDMSDTYRTYFKFRGLVSYIYPMAGEKVPFGERYRFGGYNDLRGYDWTSIGPKFRILRSPGDVGTEVNRGGDKKMLLQLEYFAPLIPEAGIKALLFTDFGRIYNDDESLQFGDFKKDLGFGFRWNTPIAPFRFEWAYPLEEKGKLGDGKVIFSIGY
jgi:outer membrane protein insertion porin family